MNSAAHLTMCVDISEYAAAVRPFLERHEAEYAMFLASLSRQEADPGTAAFMAYATRDGGVASAAFYRETNLIVSRGPAAALAATAGRLLEAGVDVPGVIGPSEESKIMASEWTRVRGCSSFLALDQMLYRLDAVRPPTGIAGRMRQAARSDQDLLAEWFHAFHREALPHARYSLEQARQQAALRLAGDMTFIWEADGAAVAMASLARPTSRGISVNAVYTPMEHRRRGYATALTAAVSAEGLQRGKEFCTLYTDLGNPTSNSIYRKIGYQPICGSRVYRFRYS